MASVAATEAVLVLDPAGRVLLFGARLVDLSRPPGAVLYWYTPVLYTPNVGKDEPNYVDWMSRYAGHEFPWEGKE